MPQGHFKPPLRGWLRGAAFWLVYNVIFLAIQILRRVYIEGPAFGRFSLLPCVLNLACLHTALVSGDTYGILPLFS